MKKGFKSLCSSLIEISHLESIVKVITWDSEVMIPSQSIIERSNYMKTLGGIIYDKKTSNILNNQIKQAEKELKESENEFSLLEKSLIINTRLNYDKECKLSKDLIQEKIHLSSIGPKIWNEARESGDISNYLKLLNDWIELYRKIAKNIDPTKPLYDVLLDYYEKGMTSKKLDLMFNEVKDNLIPLLLHIKQSKINNNINNIPNRTIFNNIVFPINKQTDICNKFIKDLGLNMDYSRFDTSKHPFTINIHPTDVRITTRYSENNIFEGFTGAIHETGHGIFEQNIPYSKDYPSLPVLSMAVHESQSLFYERMIGLSKEFYEYYLPLFKDSFNSLLPSTITSNDFYKAANIVEPGLIRVDADECTYPFHIILRTEIEKGLIEGNISVNDISDLWNTKMKEYLNIDVPDNKHGFLQDIHWSLGYFGYFPTYLLGAIYSSQFYSKISNDMNISNSIKQGDFSPIKSWLSDNIHTKEYIYSSSELLIQNVCNESINTKVYNNYLNTKYKTLYPLNQ